MRGVEAAAREVESRVEKIDLRETARVFGAAVEMPQPVDELRGVRVFPFVGAEEREDEKQSAGGAIALRLLDAGERFERGQSRVVPASGGEERVDAVHLRVDAIGDRCRLALRNVDVLQREIELLA